MKILAIIKRIWSDTDIIYIFAFIGCSPWFWIFLNAYFESQFVGSSGGHVEVTRGVRRSTGRKPVRSGRPLRGTTRLRSWRAELCVRLDASGCSCLSRHDGRITRHATVRSDRMRGTSFVVTWEGWCGRRRVRHVCCFSSSEPRSQTLESLLAETLQPRVVVCELSVVDSSRVNKYLRSIGILNWTNDHYFYLKRATVHSIY